MAIACETPTLPLTARGRESNTHGSRDLSPALPVTEGDPLPLRLRSPPALTLPPQDGSEINGGEPY